jgi:hypothetical protein
MSTAIGPRRAPIRSAHLLTLVSLREGGDAAYRRTGRIRGNRRWLLSRAPAKLCHRLQFCSHHRKVLKQAADDLSRENIMLEDAFVMVASASTIAV